MSNKELLDKHISDLDALLEMVKDDWKTRVIQDDPIWFAQLVNKTRALRDEYRAQRRKLT